MSVQGVGNGSSAVSFAEPSDQVTSTAGRLAILMLATQQDQQTADRELLQLARQDFKQALEEEVAAMREAAADVFRGALLQGGLALAGGALSAAGALGRDMPDLTDPSKADWVKQCEAQAAVQPSDLEALGSGLSPLAAPIGKMLGDADGENSRADAKQHAGEGEVATWAMNDARDRVAESKELQNRTLDWLRKLGDQDAAAMASILGNLA